MSLWLKQAKLYIFYVFETDQAGVRSRHIRNVPGSDLVWGMFCSDRVLWLSSIRRDIFQDSNNIANADNILNLTIKLLCCFEALKQTKLHSTLLIFIKFGL